MSFEAYTNPDFGWHEKLNFWLVAVGGLIFCVTIIALSTKLSVLLSKKDEDKALVFYEKTHNRVHRFYEMIIAGTSVMSFSCAYVIINHIDNLVQTRGTDSDTILAFIDIWQSSRDFVLLLLICLSCVLNSLLDKLIIPLKHASKEEKASVRMLAMFYVIIILIYLNQIGDSSEYSPVMIYYLGLMVGRFVYFDASFRDFLQAIKNLFHNMYLLLLGLILTGFLCNYGFDKEYLLERNYYIVGAFYAHLFLLAGVFVLHHSHILHLFVRKPKDPNEKKKKRGKKGRNDTDDIYEDTYPEEITDADDQIYEDPADYEEPYNEADEASDFYISDDTEPSDSYDPDFPDIEVSYDTDIAESPNLYTPEMTASSDIYDADISDPEPPESPSHRKNP